MSFEATDADGERIKVGRLNPDAKTRTPEAAIWLSMDNGTFRDTESTIHLTKDQARRLAVYLYTVASL